MDLQKLIKILKIGSLNLPIVLVRHYQALGLTGEEVIVLGYLLNGNNQFEVNVISQDLNLQPQTLLTIINQLQEKDLLKIMVEKNDNGIMEESLNFDHLYNKLALILIPNLNEQTATGIFQKFENELGCKLSAIETEIIMKWLEANYQEELILAALAEAVYNGVKNLRYIDQLLFSWREQGIETIATLKQKQARSVHKEASTPTIPDYNWLDDNKKED